MIANVPGLGLVIYVTKIIIFHFVNVINYLTLMS